MLALVAMGVLLGATWDFPADAQFINSYAGPFDIELHRIETCPGTMSGLNLLNFTKRLTRDRKHPKRFYYNGVLEHAFDMTPDLAVSIRLSSWSSRGGWKENAYSHTFPHACLMLQARATPSFKRRFHAATGLDRDISCSLEASRWTFTDFLVDTSAGEFKEFVYGKWRIDIQILDGKTVLTCYREFVDTVPRVPGRMPPESNLTGTVRLTPIKRRYP